MLSLLENFEIAFPLTAFNNSYEGKTLIPSLLPDLPPNSLEELWSATPKPEERQLSRHYQFSFIPYGLFGRMTVRLLRNFTAEKYWNNGILLILDEEIGRQHIFIKLNPTNSTLTITAR